ncbi:trichohyalin isoform X2 [Nothobranchius furzeri]|uniref:Transcript variant X1 n=1 Tax=Nothobranchius furzeri TaxID=105023 RepID=A0A9D3BXY2_NOTFU|nr:transcript variant X2 [Nothobranchius furzeri]KAF7226912.1 transcript variant X1 [Nothobranchius furzeri]
MSTQGMKCQTLSNSLLKQEGESRSSRDTPSGSTNYNAKGSKWAISTNFETLCNLTAGSSGKSSRDPSPRREMTTSLEQDKDKYDKSRRREMKNEKMGSKGGYNDTEPRRHVESERISDSRLRDAEWVVRERKPEYDASKQDMKKKRKKGDTFPRIKNGDRDPDPRVMPPEMEKERRHGHRPKREETQFWEEKIDKHKIRMRRKEDGKSPGRRPTEDERAQKRELYKMSGVEFRDTTRETIDRQDMRDRVAARRREDMRLDLDERNARMNSQQRTEREMYGRTQGRTVAKSEGDIDERRDKMRDRRGEEGDYMSKMQHNRDRDRHSGRGTEAERPRRKEEATFDRCTETDRRIARQVDKERERQMETRKDFSGYRREDDQIRRERRAREMLERREHATAERRNRSTSDPDPRVPPRVQSNRELTSSKDGENIRRDRAFYEERGPMTNWAAEIERIKEIPKKHRGGNTRIEQERRRMWLEPQKDRNSADEDRERYRRWKDREREKEMDVKSQAERARDVQRIKAEPNERDFDQRSHEGRHGGANGNDERTENGRKTFREGKGYLSDSDGRTGRKLQGCVEGENVVDDNKESGTEEEGGGDYLVRSGSEGGSDAGWMQDRDRMLSVENSSGGDEEDEREEEDKNVLCEDPTSASSKSFEGDERKEDWVTKKKVTDEDEQGRQQNSNIIFSVTGQSHPQSEATQLSLSENDEVGGAEIDEANMEKHTQRSHDITHENPQLTSSETDEQPVLTNRDKESDHSTSRFTTEDAKEDVQCEASQKLQDEELGGGNKSKEGPCVKIRPMKRDSQTEKLLKRWREQTNEPNTSEQTRPLLEDINTESMSPEEIERIQIRMSRVWATSEEPKRHSQAAHMKWAKDVMRLYMGNSEEQVEDQNTGPREDQGVAGSEYHQEPQVVSQVSFDLPTVILTRDDHLAPDLEEELGDNDDHSKSWGGMELRNVLDEIKKSQKSHGFFKDTQLYQQYIDTTQEFEILRSRSDVLSTFEDASLSPAPSPPPSRRPLPPLPSQPHLHSLSHTGSVTSAKNLPLPELPNTERRPSSPRLSISLSQSSLLWRELEDVRYSPDLELLTEDQRRLQEVRFEVVTSEASYCRSLDIVVDHFVKSKQLGQLLTTQDKNWLFSRLADVRTISRRFLSMLEQRMESDIMRFTVCDIIAEHCPRFRCVYVPYLTNQSYQDATYQKLMNGNPGFKQVVETLEKSQVCERLPLRSFLVLPFQRITRIKLLVQNIVKRTTPGTEEATHAIRALKLLEKMIRESNESISQMKNLESLVALNSKVNFECKTLPLVSQSRRLVREGAITKLSNSLKEPEKSIYLHLFNDYLLFSVPKEGGRFTVINHYPVTELCAEDCPVKLDTLQKNLFRLRTKQNLLLLRADSASDKLRWISAISPPQPIELSSVQDCAQMQCIRAYVAQQPDELSLEKADVILVHQDCDNWVEGTKLSDLHRGWMPKSHLEAIVNPKVRKRNLSDALKVTNATATA